MASNALQQEIESLIESKREDDYWDFKQCHHTNTADPLHDIICMSNNLADRDAYIIFGVADKTGKPGRKQVEKRYDYIMQSPRWQVINCEYPYDESVAASSDHSAVIADYELR
jgi:endonuclease/exonuclease/phosphatase family metal-dependent hydrolase